MLHLLLFRCRNMLRCNPWAGWQLTPSPNLTKPAPLRHMANNLKGLCTAFLINVNTPLNKSLKCCFCCTVLDQKQRGCGGSIYKFPILLLFHIFLLDQSCLNTIAAHILSLRTICLNIYGERNFHAIPQISLNLTKYLSSWGSAAVGDLPTGEWWLILAQMENHYMHSQFMAKSDFSLRKMCSWFRQINSRIGLENSSGGDCVGKGCLVQKGVFCIRNVGALTLGWALLVEYDSCWGGNHS